MERKKKVLDWAYLSKFKEENAQLKAQLFPENRILFFGDSITAGWKTYDPDLFDNNININRGINGQTTSQMILRFKSDVVDLEPKTVVILAGTNDIAGNTGPITLENILKNLISMCRIAKANSIKVLLCSVLPATDYPWRSGMYPAEKIENLNSIIQQYAMGNAITYIDYYAAMVNDYKGLKSIYSDDGVHPNREGYAKMKLILESHSI